MVKVNLKEHIKNPCHNKKKKSACITFLLTHHLKKYNGNTVILIQIYYGISTVFFEVQHSIMYTLYNVCFYKGDSSSSRNSDKLFLH